MIRDEFSFLRNSGTSDDEIRKLKIIIAFHDRLPTDELKTELLSLMRDQPSMAAGEFERRLQDFHERAQAALFEEFESPYPVNNTLARLH